MTIEPWNYETHAPLIKRWLAARGLSDDVGPPELYPKTGLVADGCVISFLYKTDAPGVGFVDGTVSDPTVSRERRAQVFDELFTRLTELADEAGISILWSYTTFKGLEAAGERVGFRKVSEGHVCLARVRKD